MRKLMDDITLIRNTNISVLTCFNDIVCTKTSYGIIFSSPLFPTIQFVIFKIVTNHHNRFSICYIAYGPIQHSNGLCINVKDDKRTLIWSKDCSSANAFFLVSYDYPPFHVATGKCVLPWTYVL